MNKIAFSLCNLDGKERADKLIASLLPQLPRNRIAILIEQQNILMDGNPISTGSFKVKNRETIEITIPAPVAATHIKPKPDIKFDIVYEDDDLLVINKPAGLTVHPGAGNHEDTLVNALVGQIDDLSGINGVMRPGIVHRLDRNTTGLMLVAKNDKAHNFLAEAIKAREVTRIYHALVWNGPSLPGGKIDVNLGRHPRERKKMSVLKSTGRHAITHYQLLKSYYDGVLSLMECKLETGRTHQIRVHMEHKQMPLVGDDTYSGQITQKKTGSLPEKARRAVLAFPRQALHAKYIAFIHPTTHEEMEFEIDYPQDIAELLESL